MPDTTRPYRQESVINWLYDQPTYRTTREIAVGLDVSVDAVRSALQRLEKQSVVGSYVAHKREGRKWTLTVAARYIIQEQRDKASVLSVVDWTNQGTFV